jgi:hypothetical protein
VNNVYGYSCGMMPAHGITDQSLEGLKKPTDICKDPNDQKAKIQIFKNGDIMVKIPPKTTITLDLEITLGFDEL